MRRLVLAAFLLALVGAARAESPAAPAKFALIIGVNRGVDTQLAPLRYADDDAARYQDLFRSLGARTYLMMRPDENTRRLHPQAAAEAHVPTGGELDRLLGELDRDVSQAHARGVETVFYFVYAGHGNVKAGQGYLTLEDRRISGADVATKIVDVVGATQAHLIVDACYSSFLAYPRGPGGQRRPVQGFSQMAALAARDRIGLLLSTGSSRESHEWEAFQAGVFSHEVRSGLYGAADGDGDGKVSYREIAAFVERANAAIPNERYRPDVLARPPSTGELLVDLREGLYRRLEIDGTKGAHYLLEDGRGVRLAEFHNGSGQSVQLLRPAASESLYLRKPDSEEEYRLPATEEVLALASLEPEPARDRPRGAAHEAFSTIFSLPYVREDVERFILRAPDLSEPDFSRPRRWRTYGGWGGVALGVAALGGGIAATLSASGLRDEARETDTQRQIAERNQSIDHRNLAAAILYGTAGAAAVTGLLLLLWPDSEGAPSVASSGSDLFVGYARAF